MQRDCISGGYNNVTMKGATVEHNRELNSTAHKHRAIMSLCLQTAWHTLKFARGSRQISDSFSRLDRASGDYNCAAVPADLSCYCAGGYPPVRVRHDLQRMVRCTIGPEVCSVRPSWCSPSFGGEGGELSRSEVEDEVPSCLQ